MLALQRQRGFTLLEAIVALTIFSMAALALFSWLGTNVNALRRVDERHAALTDARNALALVGTINPMMEPEGERRIGPLTVRWRSTPMVERKMGRGPGGGASAFDLALVRLHVEVFRGADQVDSFAVTKAGWEVARPVVRD